MVGHFEQVGANVLIQAGIEICSSWTVPEPYQGWMENLTPNTESGFCPHLMFPGSSCFVVFFEVLHIPNWYSRLFPKRWQASHSNCRLLLVSVSFKYCYLLDFSLLSLRYCIMVLVTGYQTIAIPPAGTLDFLGRMDQHGMERGGKQLEALGGCSRTICQDKRVLYSGIFLNSVQCCCCCCCSCCCCCFFQESCWKDMECTFLTLLTIASWVLLVSVDTRWNSVAFALSWGKSKPLLGVKSEMTLVASKQVTFYSTTSPTSTEMKSFFQFHPKGVLPTQFQVN